MSKLHKAGIRRVNRKALKLLIKHFEQDLANTINIITKELVVDGKRTLEENDVKKIFERLEKKEEFWEV